MCGILIRKMVAGNSFVFVFIILTKLLTTMAKQAPAKEGVSMGTTPIPCQPPPHDVLWKRIDPTWQEEDPDAPRPRTRRGVSPTGMRHQSRGRPRPASKDDWKNAGQSPTNYTTELRSGERGSRKHLLHVNLLGERHSTSDVYQAVGTNLDDQYGVLSQEAVASSRRKRKLPTGKRNRNKKSSPSERHAPSGSPWQCKFEKKWRNMKPEFFPAQVQTGKCVAKTCMNSMFECRPKKYAIRVLKRLENRCNPLPVSGPNTTYEEAWVMQYYKVTVACECSRRKPSGSYETT